MLQCSFRQSWMKTGLHNRLRNSTVCPRGQRGPDSRRLLCKGRAAWQIGWSRWRKRLRQNILRRFRPGRTGRCGFPRPKKLPISDSQRGRTIAGLPEWQGGGAGGLKRHKGLQGRKGQKISGRCPFRPCSLGTPLTTLSKSPKNKGFTTAPH